MARFLKGSLEFNIVIIILIATVLCVGAAVYYTHKTNDFTLFGVDINPLAGRNYSKKELGEIKKISKQLESCIDLRESEKGAVQCMLKIVEDLAEKRGARFSLDALQPVADKHQFLLIYHHTLAHAIGNHAVFYDYESKDKPKSEDGFTAEELTLINSTGRALSDCDGWGAFGCYHGVIETILGRLNPEDRVRVVRKACMENTLILRQQFYKNQCLHWFGHGAISFVSQPLSVVLEICNSLNEVFESDDVQLCLSGVFHSGSSDPIKDKEQGHHISEVYSESDVYFPCRTLPEKYKSQCFSHVPGRTPWRGVLTDIFTNCNNIPEKDPVKKTDYVRVCYNSAANVLLDDAELDPFKIIELCERVSGKDYAKYCYAGAVRYLILRNPMLNYEAPFVLCQNVVKEESKRMCYRALGAGNYENYFNNDILKNYCLRVDEAYRDSCHDLNVWGDGT